MWARTTEVMLALWLALSPFIFRYSDVPTHWWVLDFLCALVICTCALMSYWGPLRHVRFGVLVVALGLTGWAYFAADYPPEPAHQNRFVLGFLLIMLALVPNKAEDPPLSWQRYLQEEQNRP